MENSLHSWTWKYLYQGWIGKRGSASLSEGKGRWLRAGWVVPLDDGPQTFPEHCSDPRKVGSFPRTLTWLFSIAPKFRVASWIVTMGLWPLTRRMEQEVSALSSCSKHIQHWIQSGLFRALSSWVLKMSKEGDSQPFWAPVPKLEYPHSTKRSWLEPLLSLKGWLLFFCHTPKQKALVLWSSARSWSFQSLP